MTDSVKIDSLIALLHTAVVKIEPLVTTPQQKSIVGFFKAELGRLEDDRVGGLIRLIYRASGMTLRLLPREMADVVRELMCGMESELGCGQRKNGNGKRY